MKFILLAAAALLSYRAAPEEVPTPAPEATKPAEVAKHTGPIRSVLRRDWGRPGKPLPVFPLVRGCGCAGRCSGN